MLTKAQLLKQQQTADVKMIKGRCLKMNNLAILLHFLYDDNIYVNLSDTLDIRESLHLVKSK